jgi:hypothetical protein
MGERRGAYKVLMGKSDGKRPFGKAKLRLQNGYSRGGMGRHGLD